MTTVDWLAHTHYLEQQRTTRAIVDEAQRIWRARSKQPLDVTEWRESLLPALLALIARGQIATVGQVPAYFEALGSVRDFESESTVRPEAFVTPTDVAAVMLSTGFLRGARQHTVGFSTVTVERTVTTTIVRTVGDLVQDAGRTAASAQMAATPAIAGYHRKLQLPSCGRCAVLAGKFYRWNAGFLRHPGCDCIHIPSTQNDPDGDDAPTWDGDAAVRRGLITGLSEADKKAILEDGANLSAIVNAKRGGLRTESVFGQRVQTTKNSAGKHTLFAQRAVPANGKRVLPPRLTPSEIYKQAGGDRAKAQQMLKRYGYVV